VKTNLVDLLTVARESIVLPIPSFILKVVEKYVGLKRTLAEAGGQWAMATFIEATETTDEEKRQELMDGHIKVGNEFPSVKLNATYSFGLDDQDFVVAFETDEPKDFLDLVMKLRETEASRYTQRDTPIFTCVQMNMENILDQLF